MSEDSDYSVLSVPRGCSVKVRPDRSTVFVQDVPPPQPTQFLISRAIPKPAPEPARLPTLSELEQQVLVQEYQGAFLIDMREAAKNLTENSTFNDAAIQAWNDAIDQAVSQTARYL